MRSLHGLIAGVIAFISFVSGGLTASSPSALSIPPDQYWDGNDGPWSTFGMQLGSDDQSVRLLPATNEGAIWTVLPQGCPTDYNNCAKSRGFIFLTNRTTTWNLTGLYQLSLVEETLLGYSGNGEYGTDKAILGWPGDNLPTVPKAIIGGIATSDFHMGVLPLNPWPVNFTDLTVSTPSLLTNLKNQSSIPSLTWGYTAGMCNHVPPVFGSLTLGGYDASRFTTNTLDFSMGGDISRDLLVAIQAITSGSATLLSSPIFAFIDSLVPHIWLPISVCQEFESAFGLTWNDTYNLYLVNETLHQTLLQSNPTVRFSIGMQTGGESVAIDMPYGSFDLNASAPLVPAGSESRYFPLRRADNSSQYTLGRAFLQNAYIIANYEYFNFSVSAAHYPDTSISQQIVSLAAKGTPLEQTKSSGLSTGAIVGIAIGAAAAIIALVALLFSLYRRRKSEYAAVEPQPQTKPYPDPSYPQELGTAQSQFGELAGIPMNHEMEAVDEPWKNQYPPVELAANEPAAQEFHTPEGTPWNTPNITPSNTPGFRGQSTSPIPPVPALQGQDRWETSRRPVGGGQQH